MLNNVNTKKNFIEQITTGTIQFNNLDLGPVDDNGSIDYKTLLAVAKNDSLFLEKEQLTKKLEELKLEQSIFKKNKLEAENNIKFYNRELVIVSKNIEKLELDIPLWHQVENREGYYTSLKKSLGLPSDTNVTDIGKVIYDIAQKRPTQATEHEIFKIGHARLCLIIENSEQHSLYVKTKNATYGYGSRKIVNNMNSLADYLYNSLSKIPKSLSKQKELLSEYQNNILANKKVLGLNFDKLDELRKLEAKMLQINLDLDKKFDIDINEENTEQSTNPKKLSKNLEVGPTF